MIVREHEAKNEVMPAEAALESAAPLGVDSNRPEQVNEDLAEERPGDGLGHKSQGHRDVVIEVSDLKEVTVAGTASEWRDDISFSDLLEDLQQEQSGTDHHFVRRPAYHHAEGVEYYSWTHRRWFTAMMELAKDSTESSKNIVYNVIVRAGNQAQHRRNVELNVLRRSLREGEEVEVYTKRRGRWVPAVMHGDQKKSAASGPGYCIQVLEEDKPVISNVPADLLRRRFEIGTIVKVYRGINHGWVLALVDGPPVDLLPSAEPLGPSMSIPQELNSPLAHSPRQLSPPYSPRSLSSAREAPLGVNSARHPQLGPRPGKKLSGAPEMEVEDVDMQCMLWQLVPVRGLDGDSTIFNTIVVPSYLVLPSNVDV